MNRRVIWIIWIILIGFFVLFALNNFKAPKAIFVNKYKTTGKIVEIYSIYGIGGWRYIQKVEFIYHVNGIYYQGEKVVAIKHGEQSVGNEVNLTISANNPTKYKVKDFTQVFSGNLNGTYSATNVKCDYEIQLENSVFRYREIGENKETIKEIYGTYLLSNDTLFVSPFILSDNPDTPDQIIFLIKAKDVPDEVLIDIQTKKEFYKEEIL